MKNFIPAERKVNLEIRTGWCSVPAVDVTAWELISKIWLSRKLKENPTWGKNFGENTFLQSVLCWGRDILGSSNIITQVAVWVWKNHPCPRSLNRNKGWVCLCLSLPSTLSWYLLFLGSHVNVVTFTLSWLGKKEWQLTNLGSGLNLQLLFPFSATSFPPVYLYFNATFSSSFVQVKSCKRRKSDCFIDNFQKVLSFV